MKKTHLLCGIFLFVLLSACDNDLHLVSLDYSVSLKTFEGNLDTAEIGKPVKCVLTLSGLDEGNKSKLFTNFQCAGEGYIKVEDQEYKPGESFDYDYRENPKLSFDFIPKSEGKQLLIFSVTSEAVTRSDSVVLNVLNRDIKISFSNVPNYVRQNEPAIFYLNIESEQKDITGKVRFVMGSGQVYISGYDAINNDVPLKQGENMVAFMCTDSGMSILEFTVTSRYGYPTTSQVNIRVLISN